MARQFRIYPGIGIARLGNSPDSFFLSPEIPGLGPLEPTDDDSVERVTKYKDSQRKLRRQGARFRVYEVRPNGTGGETLREVTAENGISIQWRVELANEKAAAGKFISEQLPEDTHHLRNPGIPQSDLIIKPTFGSISGAKLTVRATTEGKFRGTEVYLGELRTDAKGRLIVLGGRGISGPSGLPIGDGSVPGPGRPRNTFANNEGWYDDIADGPI